jgi:hypothetical protein
MKLARSSEAAERDWPSGPSMICSSQVTLLREGFEDPLHLSHHPQEHAIRPQDAASLLGGEGEASDLRLMCQQVAHEDLMHSQVTLRNVNACLPLCWTLTGDPSPP